MMTFTLYREIVRQSAILSISEYEVFLREKMPEELKKAGLFDKKLLRAVCWVPAGLELSYEGRTVMIDKLLEGVDWNK